MPSFIVSRQTQLASKVLAVHGSTRQTVPSALSPSSSPSLQARVPRLEGDVAAGDVPAVLRPCHRAHLRRRPQHPLRLGQEAVGHSAQQLLLGLLLDTDYRRTYQ